MSRSGDPSGAAGERPICLPTTLANHTRHLSFAGNYCVYAGRDPRCPTTGSQGSDDVASLSEAISRHLAFVQRTRNEDDVRRVRREYHLKSLLTRSVADILAKDPKGMDCSLREAYDRVVERLKVSRG